MSKRQTKKLMDWIIVLTLFVSCTVFQSVQSAVFVKTITGTTFTGSSGTQMTTAQIMALRTVMTVKRSQKTGVRPYPRTIPGRKQFQQYSESLAVATWPINAKQEANQQLPSHALANPLSFTAGELNLSNQSFPPDSMGVVGPTQFTLCINGLIKTFDKTTGIAAEPRAASANLII